MTHDEKMTDEAIEIKPLGTRLGHQRTTSLERTALESDLICKVGSNLMSSSRCNRLN